MYRYRLKFELSQNMCDFVGITCKLPYKINLTDPYNHYCTNGKSLLGILPTIEWQAVYCECEEDIYEYIKEFVIDDENERKVFSTNEK